MVYQSIVALVLALVLPLAGCSKADSGNSGNQSVATDSRNTGGGDPPVYSFEVVKTYPHDPAAFTQGLIFAGGFLYESTGLNGASSLRKVDLTTGRVLQKVDVPVQYFAEGLTLFHGRLFQLTWQAHKGFIYDQDTFAMEMDFPFESEGWGLTHDDQYLIQSDGSNQLRFIDPSTFQVKRTINIMDRGRPLFELNELEYIKGEIYSNIWHDDRIVRIDPATGRIVGWINLAGLLSPQEQREPENVLNGIAYDDVEDRIFVTGKRWPKLFEIRLKK